MNYKVLKPFYKHSNKQNYLVGDIIELSKEDAKAMLNEGYLEESKAKEVTVKEVIETTKEVEGFKVSTKATEQQVEALPTVKK